MNIQNNRCKTYLFNKVKCLMVGLLILLLCISCMDTKEKEAVSIMQKWLGKEVHFPSNLAFTIQTKDTVNFVFYDKYKIITYVDSIGCISCKLHLDRWKQLIVDMDSASINATQFLFFFSPEKMQDVYRALKIADFSYPVCVDENDSLNKLNHFPSDMTFQTFLLDKNNKVVAIGNPVHNPKVKELYMNIIQGKAGVKEKELIQTEIEVKEQTISLGRFDWHKEQNANFAIRNVGKHLLVINDVTTSCGCTSVEYSKEPVRSGDSISLQVTFKADYPGHFNKAIIVYCNAEPQLLKLRIVGDAE